MFGDQALKLVTEAKACLNLDNVKPYNDELIRSLILETKQLYTHLSTLLNTLETQSSQLSPGSISGLQSQLLMLHLIIQYNKRSLLIYHNVRLDIINSHLSRQSFSLPILFSRHDHLRTSLSPAEHDYLKRYSDVIQRIKLDYLDLSSGLRLDISDGQVYEQVAKDLLVTVKVNRDLKDVWLSSGQTAATSLNKGQTVTMGREEIRALINRGWVSLIDGNT
ncbi:related to PSF1 - subunit of the GINS complex [Melanopsichium pennsylvanicum]|uniref:DNA replication complex GINS protein PSF1 n=1 Tax=Melanopsichium pennsylvanicum TaxID=63383 RepID=A0AAJ4XRF6_9BASI|nr:related to PSF1 - subunit of the GINS complex [Melanopsichium pennsylvanicum]